MDCLQALKPDMLALCAGFKIRFLSRLVALVPKPGVHLTRFHGVFVPNSNYRALVTPTKRGK
jgi:hypothetical protein